MVNFIAIATVLAKTVIAHQPFPVQFAAEGMGQKVTVCLDGRKVETTFAGKLGFRDQNHSWFSVCGAVRAPVYGGQYFYVKAVGSSSIGGNIQRAGNIVAKFFRAAKSNEQCAGLQIAVWEAIEDGGEQPNFGNGRFQVRASDAALAWAEEYYQAITEPGNAVFLQTTGGQGQSQISESTT